MELKKASYAVIGSGDFAVEKSRSLFEKARGLRKSGRSDVERFYGDLAKRGQTLVSRIQRSKPAKRAVDSSKQATRQLKGAVTSVRKALGFEETKTTTRKAS